MLQLIAALLACAAGSPIELTPEVAEATAAHLAAVEAAKAGEHAKLAPVNSDVQAPAPVFTGVQPAGPAGPIAAEYLADVEEVAAAKAAFDAAFKAAAAGEHAALAPVNSDVQAPAPVHVVPAPAPLAAAPVAAFAGYPYAHAGYPYAHAGFPYTGYAGYAGLPYLGGYHGLHYGGYAGLHHGLPILTTVAAKAE